MDPLGPDCNPTGKSASFVANTIYDLAYPVKEMRLSWTCCVPYRTMRLFQPIPLRPQPLFVYLWSIGCKTSRQTVTRMRRASFILWIRVRSNQIKVAVVEQWSCILLARPFRPISKQASTLKPSLLCFCTSDVHIRVCHDQAIAYAHLKFCNLVLSTKMFKSLLSKGFDDGC